MISQTLIRFQVHGPIVSEMVRWGWSLDGQSEKSKKYSKNTSGNSPSLATPARWTSLHWVLPLGVYISDLYIHTHMILRGTALPARGQWESLIKYLSGCSILSHISTGSLRKPSNNGKSEFVLNFLCVLWLHTCPPFRILRGHKTEFIYFCLIKLLIAHGFM